MAQLIENKRKGSALIVNKPMFSPNRMKPHRIVYARVAQALLPVQILKVGRKAHSQDWLCYRERGQRKMTRAGSGKDCN